MKALQQKLDSIREHMTYMDKNSAAVFAFSVHYIYTLHNWSAPLFEMFRRTSMTNTLAALRRLPNIGARVDKMKQSDMVLVTSLVTPATPSVVCCSCLAYYDRGMSTRGAGKMFNPDDDKFKQFKNCSDCDFNLSSQSMKTDLKSMCPKVVLRITVAKSARPRSVHFQTFDLRSYTLH